MDKPVSDDLFESDDEEVNTIDDVQNIITNEDNNKDDRIRENIWLVLDLIKKDEYVSIRNSIYEMLLTEEKKMKDTQNEGCSIQ